MPILTDKTYVEKADKAIKGVLADNDGKKLTTSKLRNLQGLTSRLFDESKSKKFEELSDKLAYLRVQYVYQAGREKSVKVLVDKAEILQCLAEVKDRQSLQRFCRYMEALIAYFKFNGGKD